MGMKSISLRLTLVSAVVVAGCASPLPYNQKQELKNYEAKGLAVEEKSPGLAAGLGLLPGFGSFYTRSYGYGVLNLLLWPLSVLWDPVSGYDGAVSINYYATKSAVTTAHRKERSQLERLLEEGKLSQTEYIRRVHALEDYYSGDTLNVAPSGYSTAPATVSPYVAAPESPAPALMASIVAPQAAAPAKTQLLIKANASLRATPQKASSATLQVIQGTSAAIVSEIRNADGHWFFVNFGGQVGWVLDTDVQL